MSASAESHKRRRAEDDDHAAASNGNTAAASAASNALTAATPANPATAPSAAADLQPEKKIKLEGGGSASAAPGSANASSTAAAAAPGSTTVTKKKRRWDTEGDASSAATPVLASSSAASATPASSAASSTAATPATSADGVPLTAAQKALALQKSIAERLAAAKLLKATPSTGTPAVKQESTAAATAAALSAAGLNPALHHISPSVIVKDESKSWVPLRLDAQGRPIDEQGRVIQSQRHSEFKVNQKAAEEAAAAAAGKQAPKHAASKISTTVLKSEGQSRFHDPRMPHEGKPLERKSKALVMVKPGKYIAQAATMRMKQLEKDLKDAAKSSEKSTPSAAATPAAAIQIVKPSAIPSVEWWDAKLLRDPLGLGYASEPNTDRVSSYIYHPVEVGALVAAAPPPPMPVLLTKKERKKIRKRTKRELLKEKQDRVRLGLEAPPEPKMRIANLMNVLLNDTVADPSAMEAKVRAQMAERVEAHESANAAAKLTSEQKAEKRRRKFAEDLSGSAVHVAVYRAGELGDNAGKARYQLSVNTEQWNLSGVAVLHPECNVVIVEGGPKAQRRFQRLMIHRIKWKRRQKNAMEKAAAGAGEDAEMAEEDDESDSDEEDDDEPAGGGAAAAAGTVGTVSRTGACVLVWSGTVAKARFPPGRFTFEACRSEVMARNFLKAKGMESYWDMCRAIPANSKQQIDI